MNWTSETSRSKKRIKKRAPTSPRWSRTCPDAQSPQENSSEFWFFCPLSFTAYHAVGSFLSLRGASSMPPCSLCLLLYFLSDTTTRRRITSTVMPPPMAKARRRNSENDAARQKRGLSFPQNQWQCFTAKDKTSHVHLEYWSKGEKQQKTHSDLTCGQFCVL